MLFAPRRAKEKQRPSCAKRWRPDSNFLAACVAEIIGEWELAHYTTEMVTAFDRFLIDPVRRDPTCAAKYAIAESLNRLEYRDAQGLPARPAPCPAGTCLWRPRRHSRTTACCLRSGSGPLRSARYVGGTGRSVGRQRDRREARRDTGHCLCLAVVGHYCGTKPKSAIATYRSCSSASPRSWR